MIDSRGLGDGSFKFNSKVARPGSSGTATTTSDHKSAGVGEHRQEQHQSLTIGRQLVGGWSAILDGDGPPKSAPPPQEEATPQDLSRNSQAKMSGSDNAQVTRVQVQVFSKPENESRMQEGPSEGQRETEAQTKTNTPPGNSTTGAGGASVTVKNVTTTSASASSEATPGDKPEADPTPKGAGQTGPASRTGEQNRQNLRAESNSERRQNENAQKDVKAQQASRSGAVVVPNTLGNPHKAVQVYQSLMGQGIVTTQKPKGESESKTDSRRNDIENKEREKDGRAGQATAGGRPKGSQARDARSAQAALSGSVGKRDEDREKGPARSGLSAGWSGKAGADARLSNGRVVTAQVPMYSPILDMESKRLAPTQGKALQGQQLAEFALAHAGHSIEALLKKAYQLDSRKELNRRDAMYFMALVLKLGGDFTFDHSSRVLDLARDLGDEIGLDEEARRDMELGVMYKDLGEMALVLDEAPPGKLEEMGKWMASQDLMKAGFLHDLGKTQIPPEILYKPGKLTDEEYELMKLHPVLGERMIRPIESLRHLCPVVRHHHERWDGKGYPDGIRGEAIPMASRIISIVDVFDALTEERPYKAAMPVEKVKAILQEGKGTHFDPDLAVAFGRVIQRRYPELGNPFE